jgi:hypothetical protein
VLHATDDKADSDVAAHGRGATCARCGGRMAVTQAGKVKRRMRYCSGRCRVADVRERRVAARADLLRALDDLRDLEVRIRAALAVMGHSTPGRGQTLRDDDVDIGGGE